MIKYGESHAEHFEESAKLGTVFVRDGPGNIPKKISILALVVFIIVLLVVPVRKHVTSVFNKDKGKMTEAQIIGSISGYNGRVKEIQKTLKDLGFEPGSADGRMGERTRRAIKEFQQRKEFTVSGDIDSKTWSELKLEKERLVKDLLNPEHKSDLSVECQSAMSAEDIKQGPENINRKSEVQDNIIGYRLKSKSRIKQAQDALKRTGFYPGDVDGKLGPQTKGAVKAFQKSRGLNPDGVIGVRTWEELNRLPQEQ